MLVKLCNLGRAQSNEKNRLVTEFFDTRPMLTSVDPYVASGHHIGWQAKIVDIDSIFDRINTHFPNYFCPFGAFKVKKK